MKKGRLVNDLDKRCANSLTGFAHPTLAYNGRNNGNGYIRVTQRGLADSQNKSTPIGQRKL